MHDAYLWMDGAHSPSWNMAADEILLERAFEFNRIILRFYAWETPALSYGYSQVEASLPRHDLPNVKRPTGGGIVFHGHDVTYTLAVPHSHALCRRNRKESYLEIHRILCEAFQKMFTPMHLEMNPDEHDRVTLQCFRSPSLYDILSPSGVKVAGAAQRRTRLGILHQGCIQNIPETSHDELRDTFRRMLAHAWELEFHPFPAEDDFFRRAVELTEKKYMEIL